MVIIKELLIKNCLSFTHVLLHFEENNFASIFNCATAFKLKSKLIKAIQPFFCKDMVELGMDGKIGIDRSASYIQIKFIIPKAAGKDFVDAKRFSSNPNQIVYYFNHEQYTDPIRVFHERCQIDVSSYYPFLRDIFSNENNNLLFNWASSNCVQRPEKVFEYLGDYLQISDSQSYLEQRRIAKLSNINSFIGRECDFVEKRTFVDVANEIGRIFHYVTFEEYNVKFVIPLFGENLNVSEVKWDDMALNKIETRVKKKSGHADCVWNQLEPGLKNILKISEMIALSKYLKQRFISIEDTTILEEYQNQEMIKEAILQKNGENIANWERKNFLKQIVDVCNNLEIMVFINYCGELPLPPMNANIIRCGASHDTGPMYVCTNLQSMSLDDFLNIFLQNSNQI